jgi:hypothetical protein
VLGAQGSRSQITERWIVAPDEFSKGALAVRIVQVDWMFQGKPLYAACLRFPNDFVHLCLHAHGQAIGNDPLGQ